MIGAGRAGQSLVILRNGVAIRTVLLVKSTVTPPPSTPTTRPNPYESWQTRSSTRYFSSTGSGFYWKGLLG